MTPKKVSRSEAQPPVHHRPLSDYRIGFERGHESAMWDAMIFCSQTKSPQPEWLSDALIKYGKDRINKIPIKKRGRGRPRQNAVVAAFIFNAVNRYRESYTIFGRAQKFRKLSQDQAIETVKQEVYALYRERLSTGAIKARYREGRKIVTDPTYYVSPHLEPPLTEGAKEGARAADRLFETLSKT